ncbi:acyl-CoA dehydrogenase [Agrobacterium tumefaciens]|nr:acyl-CoA dehydrogenase [Agrobacterium tumefaciens]KAJ32701.1 acyl-CoA dehydrogenase [Agrobacterium tumefaciens]
MTELDFHLTPPSSDHAALRVEVRTFLRDAMPTGYGPSERARSWTGFDAGFSRKLGARGWIGMTLPVEYGGHGRNAIERHIVVEELLAAGAPVAAHWIADRQSAPMILHNGTDEQRRTILPRIAAGECYFCIGMSEPDSGSDLASVRMRAEKTDGGYRLTGTKLWTTYAHEAHYMIAFCRTGPSQERHGGMSQFLVDMTLPGISVRPVLDMAGEHHFNEVSFEGVEVPASALLGKEGAGWSQVMSELSFERSGPERFLSSFALVDEIIRAAPEGYTTEQAMGRLTAHLLVLRHMSQSVAGRLARGEKPDLHAAVVKDLGATFEQDMPEIARTLVSPQTADDEFNATLARLRMAAPSFSLRGGTREVLRGIIARGLGLR